MAEDGQGPGLPEVEKIGDVGEVIVGVDSLAVSSEGSDDDTKNPNAADTPPTSKKDEGLVIVPFGTPPPTEECPRLCISHAAAKCFVWRAVARVSESSTRQMPRGPRRS